MSQQPDDNVFHQHLDKCERCRNQPFNLCPVGDIMLRKAVQDLPLVFPDRTHVKAE